MFGTRLKQLRNENGLHQDELAEKIGVKRAVVGQYENDKVFPSVEVLIKIADYFEVSIDYLLGRTNIIKLGDNIEISKTNSNVTDQEKKIIKELYERLNLDS